MREIEFRPGSLVKSMEPVPQRYVKLAGWMYLVIIALGIFGEAIVRGSLVVPGDAGATARAVAADNTLWRAGIAGDLLMHIVDLPVTILLYLLLRAVSRGLALIATAFCLTQTAVLVANKMTLVLPLVVHDSAALAAAFTPAQIDALAFTAIQTHGYGFGVGLIFFGAACILRGYLVARSGFLPPVLGWLLVAAGVSYLVNSFALLLAPSIASALFPAILLPAFVGEFAFAAWLAFKGIDAERWRACAVAG
jgi:hypothetical protein